MQMVNSSEKTGQKDLAAANCAHFVFLSLQNQFNLGGGPIGNALSFYPGGKMDLVGTCGAAIGGMMAIGAAYGGGTHSPGNHHLGERAIHKFINRFTTDMGGITCRDVMKSAPAASEPVDGGKQGGKRYRIGHARRCVPNISNAINIASEILAEHYTP